MSAGVVATQMAIIFLFMMTGYVLTKQGKFSERTCADMSFLMVNICTPAMILYGVLSDQSVTLDHLITMGIVTVIVYSILVVAGIAMGPLLRAKRQDFVDYRLMTVFGNVGFIGYPVILAVVGPKGMPYAVIYNLGFNLVFYTYGVLIMGSEEEEQRRIEWKKLINPGTVCGLLSIGIILIKPSFPAPVMNCLNYLGSMVTFMTVAIIGHSLAHIPLGNVFRDRRVYIFVLLRFVVLPVMLGTFLKCVVSDNLMVYVTTLLMAMPVGSLPMMLAKEQGRDAELLTRGVVISTLLSVVTIVLVTSVVEIL